MLLSFAVLAGLLTGVGQLAAPDSLVLPVWADTTIETEVAIFPPAGAELPLWYQIAWGDGDTMDWTGPLRSPTDISRYHKYRNLGQFSVAVRARDSLLRTSSWSKAVTVDVAEPVQKWYYETPEPIVAAVSLDLHGNLYVGDENGTLYSLTPDGRLRWTFSAKDAIYGAAAIVGDLLYFGSLDSNLYCLDTTGKQRWACDLDDELYCPPALGVDGTIYVGTDAGTLVAVTPRGKIRWKFKTGDEIASSPTVGHNGLIYVASDSVYCLDGKGKRRWTFGSPGGDYFFAAPIPDGRGTVYAGNTDGFLYCIGPNGRQQWRAPAPEGDEIRPEVVFGTDSALYFGSDGYFLIHKKPDATPTVLYEANDILIAPTAISDKGTAYFLPDDGTLYSLTSGGRLLWMRDVASGDKDVYYTSAPTIGPDGTVYAGSWDGGIYAFRGDGPPANTLWPQFRHDAQHTGRMMLPGKKR